MAVHVLAHTTTIESVSKIEHMVIFFFGFDDITDGRQVLGLLENVSIEYCDKLAFLIILFQFIRWAIADRRIAKHWPCALLNISIQLRHMLSEVQPETLLLLLTIFELRKIYAEVELVKLVLSAQLNSIESPWFISVLLLNLLLPIDATMDILSKTRSILFFIFLRNAIRYK